jgi:hypothetical protein
VTTDRKRQFAIDNERRMRAICDRYIPSAIEAGKDKAWAMSIVWGACRDDDVWINQTQRNLQACFNRAWRKWERTVVPNPAREEARCSTHGCDRPRHARALCSTCYKRSLRAGHGDGAGTTAVPPGNPQSPVVTGSSAACATTTTTTTHLRNERTGRSERPEHRPPAGHTVIGRVLADIKAGREVRSEAWDIHLDRSGLPRRLLRERARGTYQHRLVDLIEMCCEAWLTDACTEPMWLAATVVCELMGSDPNDKSHRGSASRLLSSLVKAKAIREVRPAEPSRGLQNGCRRFEPYLADMPGVEVTLAQIYEGSLDRVSLPSAADPLVRTAGGVEVSHGALGVDQVGELVGQTARDIVAVEPAAEVTQQAPMDGTKVGLDQFGVGAVLGETPSRRPVSLSVHTQISSPVTAGVNVTQSCEGCGTVAGEMRVRSGLTLCHSCTDRVAVSWN